MVPKRIWLSFLIFLLAFSGLAFSAPVNRQGYFYLGKEDDIRIGNYRFHGFVLITDGFQRAIVEIFDTRDKMYSFECNTPVISNKEFHIKAMNTKIGDIEIKGTFLNLTGPIENYEGEFVAEGTVIIKKKGKILSSLQKKFKYWVGD